MAAMLALTHPAIALLSLAFGACGFGLSLLRRPFPRASGHRCPGDGRVPDGRVLRRPRRCGPPTNPTIAAQHTGGAGSTTSIHSGCSPPSAFFPLLAVLWLLMLAPGLDEHGGALAPVKDRRAGPGRHRSVVRGEWHERPAPGSSPARRRPMSWPWRWPWRWLLRPTAWRDAARRPLAAFAALMAVAAISYSVDLALLCPRGRGPSCAAGSRRQHAAALSSMIPRSPSPTIGTGHSRHPSNGLAARIMCATSSCPTIGGQRMTLRVLHLLPVEPARRAVPCPRPARRMGSFRMCAPSTMRSSQAVRRPSTPACCASSASATAFPDRQPRQQQQGHARNHPAPSLDGQGARDPAAPRSRRPGR